MDTNKNKYETPVSKSVWIDAEGCLCTSLNAVNDIEGYDYETFAW